MAHSARSPGGEKDLSQEQFGMEAALRGLHSRGYVPAVVYDVGAATGSWTASAMQLWPQAQFVCFEPLAERQPALREVAQQSGGRVRICPVGVGDTNGELSLGITEQLWDSSFAYAGTSARTVPVRRLDTLLAEGVPPPSFIKIDVQGFEKRVLDGGTEAVRYADLILMECQFFALCADMRTLDETIAHLSVLGFIPYEFVDFLRRPLDGAMAQCDILFARRGIPLVRDLRWVA